MKFKVGDRVKFKNSDEIHEIDDVNVKSLNGTRGYSLKGSPFVWYGDDLEAVKEECAMKFKVGDRVLVHGLTGEISDIDAGNNTYFVGGCWYGEDVITAAPSKLAELLGVKDNTPFNIVDSDGSKYRYAPFMVSDGKIIDCDGDARDLFLGLLTGEAKAVPIGDEWHDGMTMYYVDSCGNISEIEYGRCDDLCVVLVLLGNAFTTSDGAKSAAERINADIIEKLGEC